jgi:predicted permease
MPGRNRSVVLSETLWRTRFGGDSSIIGRVLVLDSVPMTVVGVMGVSIDLNRSEHLWMPKVFDARERADHASAYYSVGARLKPGVTVDAAAREMATLAHELAVAHGGANAKGSALVLPLADVLIGDARRPLLLLLGAVGFVLLVSCSNVANLQLAQTVRRARELAIRAALGAGRGRLVRQLLAESVVLAMIGGAAGVVVAYLGVHAIRALAPADLPRVAEIGVSTPLLLFALLLSAATALIFGTIPMIEAGRAKHGESLVGAGTRSGSASRARRQVQRALVGAEIALAMVLLVGAGLLARSFDSLLRVDRGYDTSGVTNVTLQAWSYYPTPEARVAFVDEAISRLQAIPGVTTAGMTSSLPLSIPIGMERTSAAIEGQPHVAAAEQPSIRVASTTGSYFSAMHNPVRSGRVFDRGDGAGGMPVVVVNEAFARRYWPGGNAVGKHVSFGFMSRPVERTVVGVVADMRHEGLAADPEPMAFIPHAQAPTGAMQFVIRASVPASTLQRAVKRELSALNGVMPLSEITSLDARLAESLRERRFQLSMLAAFSGTALLLAAIGIYGMMSYMTTERTKEIGVRIAIGALRADVVRMVMRQGVLLTATSMVVGLAGASALTRLMTSMLFGVGAMDPATYAAAALALFAVAGLASWIAARRAASIDPLSALRSE